VKKKEVVKVYAEGGGSGAGSSDLQSELRQGFADFFAKTDLGKMRRPRVVACGGREQALDMFRTAVKNGENALLLVDSETKVTADDFGKPWRHLKTQAGWEQPDEATDDDAHLMVQCMENWFLADQDAVEKFFGQGFRRADLPHGKIEEIAKKDALTALQTASKDCKSKGTYGKGPHSFKLLGQLDPVKVKEGSDWADRFIKELEKRKK